MLACPAHNHYTENGHAANASLRVRACSRREHPGRISTPKPSHSASALTAGRARTVPLGRILRAGDPELRLRVEGLNGFAAMMATMKEMGYDSDGDDEIEEELPAKQDEKSSKEETLPEKLEVKVPADLEAAAPKQPSPQPSQLSLSHHDEPPQIQTTLQPHQKSEAQSIKAADAGTYAARLWVMAAILVIVMAGTGALVAVLLLADDRSRLRLRLRK